MSTPAITVLLPVYRPHLPYLKLAIESILQQSFGEFELLVVEAAAEGSHRQRAVAGLLTVPLDRPKVSHTNDCSGFSIDSLLQDLNDERIVLHRFAGAASLVDQLNCGLKLARAPLIARMDGDDWAYPERLRLQYDYLQTHSEITVVGSQLCIMDEADRPLGRRRYPNTPEEIAATLPRFNAMAHPSVMYRRDAILRVGGYSYRRFPANEDYELWCRLVRRGERLANLDRPLLRYRIHPAGMKSSKLKGILRGTRLVKRHYYGGKMSLSAHARYVAEGLLLNLPGPVIMRLFRWVSYE